jgi:hypothetical protein
MTALDRNRRHANSALDAGPPSTHDPQQPSLTRFAAMQQTDAHRIGPADPVSLIKLVAEATSDREL